MSFLEFGLFWNKIFKTSTIEQQRKILDRINLATLQQKYNIFV